MDPRKPSTVYLIDDDADFRDSMRALIESLSVAARIVGFESAERFLETLDDLPDAPRCLLLDIGLPGMDGVAMQAELQRRRFAIPIVILTGLSDVPLAVQAVRRGAVDVIQKPVPAEKLLASINKALSIDCERRRQTSELNDVLSRLESLSKRERDVMTGLLDGQFTKDVAARLGIGTQTVLKHRARMLKKLQVRNEVALSQLLSSVGLTPTGALSTEQTVPSASEA